MKENISLNLLKIKSTFKNVDVERTRIKLMLLIVVLKWTNDVTADLMFFIVQHI